MSQTITLPDAPRTVFVYAGFWWRVLAAIIDWIIFSVLNKIILLVIVAIGLVSAGAVKILSTDSHEMTALIFTHAHAAGFNENGTHIHFNPTGGIIYSLLFIFNILYSAAFDSSRLQGTPGKLACRLRVTNEHGKRISFLRALVRAILAPISGWTFFGVVMVAWTSRKQGLHDLLTRVLILRETTTSPIMFVPPSS